uniref:MARVEL domain-containing protein n=1 Tax=Panagrellus redivivus TaxID=6233 RepID=A0A7E4UU08_PANRE
MAVLGSFDHNNPKYLYCGRIHVRALSRVISIILAIGTVINLIYSLTQSSAVIFYCFVIAAFCAGVYGSLIYGVFKEKRAFLIPFLIFQIFFVIIDCIIFIAFVISIATSRKVMLSIARDFLSLNDTDTDSNVAHVKGLAIFAAIVFAIYILFQAWFLSVFHSFFKFLKDRETSFGFNMEPEFRLDGEI